MKFYSIFILLFFICNSSYADQFTEAELRSLPPFCKDGFSKYNFKNKNWMNHLCPGLNELNRAKNININDKDKNIALHKAERGLSYTLFHVKEFPFRSTVYVKRGNVYEMQGNIQKAIADYRNAIKIQPHNVYAYSALADLLNKVGKKKEALSIIEKGLKAKPNSKLLRTKKNKIASLK